MLTQNPRQTAQLLFFLNTLIWLAIGSLTFRRMSSNGSLPPTTALIIALLMLGNSGAMALAGLGIGRRRRIFYYFALLLLLVNIILTFTDQFGLLDLLTLLIDLLLLAILLLKRIELIECDRKTIL